jgi:hypothetical protein
VLEGPDCVAQKVVQPGEIGCGNCHEEFRRAGGGGGEADLRVATELFAGLLQTTRCDVDLQQSLGADAQ